MGRWRRASSGPGRACHAPYNIEGASAAIAHGSIAARAAAGMGGVVAAAAATADVVIVVVRVRVLEKDLTGIVFQAY